MANRVPADMEPRPEGLRGLRERIAEMTALEQTLWAVAGVLVIVALALGIPTLLQGTGEEGTAPGATRAAQAGPPTRTPVATLTPLPTATRSPTPFPTLEPLEIPTPPAGGLLLTFSPDPDHTGWLGSKELGPHWRDRNLHSGMYQGQALINVLQFDLTSLAPGSRILYAALEITGRNARYLGKSGEWTLDLVHAGAAVSWEDVDYATVRQAPAAAPIGTPLPSTALSAGLTNRYVLNRSQLAALQSQLDTGVITLRLSGPSDGADNLFTWEGGPGPGEPTLYLVVVPSSFTVITPTPTPRDVYQAATLVARQRAQAQQFGTSTPFPRSIATATPGATGVIVVTVTPTPENAATATAQSVYATAVAFTTGTFTPTPPNVVTATPTPTPTPTIPFVGLSQFTPIPTATPRATEISLLVYPKTPVPADSQLIGRIAFMTNREGAAVPQIWVMEPNGNIVGKLNGPDYYQVASVHDLFSPDNSRHLDMDKDGRDKWQIVMFDTAKGVFSPLITEEARAPGIGVYHPSWSPDGNKVAFVSERTGNSEVYVYDLQTQKTKRLTFTSPDDLTKDWASNKHPSWSPDGKSIVFTSQRDNWPRWQIWIMNADGGGLRNLSPSLFSDYDPVWVKR